MRVTRKKQTRSKELKKLKKKKKMEPHESYDAGITVVIVTNVVIAFVILLVFSFMKKKQKIHRSPSAIPLLGNHKIDPESTLLFAFILIETLFGALLSFSSPFFTFSSSSSRPSWRPSFHPSLQPFSLPVDGMVGG